MYIIKQSNYSQQEKLDGKYEFNSRDEIPETLGKKHLPN
jgi:hypothetical protein